MVGSYGTHHYPPIHDHLPTVEMPGSHRSDSSGHLVLHSRIQQLWSCRSDTDRACAGCCAAEIGNNAARMAELDGGAGRRSWKAELEGGSAALCKACAFVDLDRRIRPL